MKLLRIIIFTLAALSILGGCNSKKDAPEKPKLSETKLYKVDKNIATAKILFDIQAKTSCFMASRKDKLSSLKANSHLEKILAEDIAVCSLYKAAEPHVTGVFQRIEESGVVSAELYFFKIFLSSYDEKENPIFNDELFGLFDSKEVCEKFRKIALESDIPNKSCKKLSGNPFLE